MRRKLHDFIIKAITVLMVWTFMLSVCLIESESIIPIIAMLVSMAWLGLFALANEEVVCKEGDF